MSAYNSSNAAAVPHSAAYGTHVPVAAPGAPVGTFAPGTKIQVGSHKVVIQKYLSEGGFAHVYLVKMPKAIDGTDIAVLKRVAVPDKDSLANMRTEVETMKKLKGHRPIVTYYDSHASQLKGGGYEVFLLMEFCNGGGLIDFMNTRLQNRLTEPEILKIFSDVAEGVACMHYLKPPLLHRDLKVENVLITSAGGSRRFKLCDFGSTAPPRPAGSTAIECRLIEEDVQKHTTLQYRSPEMVDVYRKQPIDEKSDIWALGVLLYKLCYYTTPFEEQGQLAILNASFKFPSYPPFSDKVKKLIASMLRESPRARPNIYQVLREACLMQGIEVPIKDIYAGRTESESRRNQQLPSPTPNVASPAALGAVYSPPVKQQNAVPDIIPMRRGRPTTTPQMHVAKPSPSPMRGTVSDPFAALDSKTPLPDAADEIASRFPSLDQFSLLHDHGNKFEFNTKSQVAATKPKDLNQRVTERLADDAFATSSQSKSSISQAKPSTSEMSKAQKIISSSPALQQTVAPPAAHIPIYAPTPSRPVMVSQGTMTSPSPPPAESQVRRYNASPVHRFAAAKDHYRSASVPRADSRPHSGRQQWGTVDDKDASNSNGTSSRAFLQPPSHEMHASSSRPSLEGGRPTFDHVDPIARTQSSNSRPRPTSTHVESSLDYLRDREALLSKQGFLNRQHTSQKPSETAASSESETEEGNIKSNIEFLRKREQEEEAKKSDRRRISGEKKAKRSSMPSMSLTGTKTILAGRFGDAFKRFENNATSSSGRRSPSPSNFVGRRDLTPIAGSEATDGRSDDGQVLDDSEDLPPEHRREMERRRLSMEEKRVAAGAAEYRKRLADRDATSAASRSTGSVTRAASIQNKVKTLLDDNQNTSSTKRTAEGYGRYTDAIPPAQPPNQSQDLPISSSAPASTNPYLKPAAMRKPMMASGTGPASATQADNPYSRLRPSAPVSAVPNRTATLPSRATARPSAPPKPTHLNSATTGPQLSSSSPPKASVSSSLARRPLQARPDMTQAEKDDYVAEFSKRYPSLSGIEMVETAIEVGNSGRETAGGGRTKEV
ncbi:MAG: hypothetical protein M1818_006489 [Claussenomyces sp. TS43310]|nr:MAG: hypothetical protein M1818_006489 [Claussenomyces sp. TS43310]